MKEVILMILKKIKFMSKKNRIMLFASLSVIFLSIIVSIIMGDNIVESGFKSLYNALTGTYTKEVKQVIIESLDHSYENGEGGSWQLEESTKWEDVNHATLNFNLTTVSQTNRTPKDYIVVLDTSGSMIGEEIVKLKDKVSELTDLLLSNDNNKMALISYSSSSSILSGFTNNKESIKSKLSTLEARGDTNYSAALKNVIEVLKKENYKSSMDRDLVLLFFTDGYPNIDTPNQVAEYQYLKNEYSNLNVIGIQYEMDVGNVINELKEISDKQIRASYDTLINALLSNFNAYLPYDHFKIEYTVDTDSFYIEEEDDIDVSIGNVELISDTKGQKIVWDFSNSLTTGSKANMRIPLSFKVDKDKKGYFGTNDKIVVNYKVNGENKTNAVTSTVSPVLKRYYDVIYDTNIPYDREIQGCNIRDQIIDSYKPYTTVTMKNDELICSGYQFLGWEIADDSIDGLIRINDEKFIMPSHDVVIRATWSSVGITKTMGGTIHEKHTLYDQILKDVESKSGITTLLDTTSNKYPIYYYTSNVSGGYKNNNNVIFAGFCWKIIRTTDTSGIKLIYNGEPDSNETCPYYGNGNNGTDTQISASAFNSKNTLSYVGYMNNIDYSRKSKQMATTETLISNLRNLTKTNYYYADSVTYNENTKRYSLVEAKQFGAWSDHYSEIAESGRYTCRSEKETDTCGTIYYVFGGASSTAKYVTISGGKGIEDYYITLSSSYTGSNPYHLDNPVKVSYVDWFTNYSTYNNYYVCSDFKTTNGCTNLYYVIGTSNNSISYVNMENKYKYGNSVKYENGVYTLTEDNGAIKTFWDWEENYRSLNNNHYTCFNTTGVCDEVYYLNYVNSSEAYYISLKDGNKIEDALELMLGAGDSSSGKNQVNESSIHGTVNPNYVHKNNSVIKTTLDNWFKESMLLYNNYLEDTVFCNERDISDIGSWSPNNGDLTSSFMSFKASSYNHLTCSRKIDRFTVSNEIGNGALTYPVGLITYNEVKLAGINAARTGSSYWTMSPRSFESNDYYFNSNAWYVFKTGDIDSSYLTSSYGIRPVIALRPGVEYTRGDGSYRNPYKVDIA